MASTANACDAVRVEENAVSHVPSFSQSQRAWSVALNADADEVDASKVTATPGRGHSAEDVIRATTVPDSMVNSPERPSASTPFVSFATARSLAWAVVR